MQENRISAAVCNQVLRFFRLNCKKLMGRMHEADISLFNDLPVQIRVELHKQVHMPLLLEHPMFKRFAANEMESVCHLAVANGSARLRCGSSGNTQAVLLQRHLANYCK